MADNDFVWIKAYGTPAPAGSKKGFYNAKTQRVIVTDDSKRSRPGKAVVSEAAGEAMRGRGLFRGPLRLHVAFYVPRPKGHMGARGVRPSAPTYPTTRPDISKLLRAVEDAMIEIVYKDDSQIVHQEAVKCYGEPARAEIMIEALDSGPDRA